MNFLRTVHLYKLSNGYQIQHGIRYYNFGEVMSKVESLLARLTWASEQAAEGASPAESNNAGECPQTSVPLLGRTTYRFTTPQDSACGQTPVWPGDEAA